MLALLTAAWQVSAAAQQPQSTGGTDRSAWFSYFADHPFAPTLALHLEGSYRRTLGLSQFEQVMLRPGLTLIENKHWQSLFAYTYFFSEPTAGGSFGPSPFRGRQVEHRAFEQQIFEHRLFRQGDRAVTLAHRARLEQRWIGMEMAGGTVPDWRFSERARYRLTAHIPVGAPTPGHYVTAFNEVYTDFGPHSQTSPFYANVTYAALGTRVRPHLSIEVGYQYRHLTEPGGITGRNDSSLQLFLLSTAPLRHNQ